MTSPRVPISRDPFDLRVRRTILVALSVPVMVISLLAGLLAWGVASLSEHNRWVVHTYDVIGESWHVYKLLLDHETGLRGYLLSRDRAFLEPYESARTEIPPAFERLSSLVVDNPAERAQLVGLRMSYESWRRKADKSISSAETVSPGTPGFMQDMRDRKADMDAMRETTLRILREEDRLLGERQRRVAAFTGRLLVGGALISLALGMVAAIALRRLLGFLRISYSQAYESAVESARTAEEANRAKDQFLATLSHELRTPLNAIVGWSHILRDKALDPVTLRKGVDTIHRNALVQNQLISDILDVSRIITGKLRLDIRAIELPVVIEQALESLVPAAEAKDLRMTSILDPGAGPISGDGDRLQQVVWNLISNAIKFTPKGGRVQVRLERVNSHVEIVVEDDGAGISPLLLPHVFERFRQGDSSASRLHGGLGLGLAIVRHLVELHGGTVSAANREGVSGAVFTVRLPLRPVTAVAAPATIEDRHPLAANSAWLESAPSLSGIRVLAVDDEADARDLVREWLVRCGARVVVAASAAEALELLVSERPHVLVADLGMPGEDGYALIRRVRALAAEQGGDTPAVALTAFAGSEDRLRVLRAGFQMHLPKPVEPVELATVVGSLAGGASTRGRSPE